MSVRSRDQRSDVPFVETGLPRFRADINKLGVDIAALRRVLDEMQVCARICNAEGGREYGTSELVSRSAALQKMEAAAGSLVDLLNTVDVAQMKLRRSMAGDPQEAFRRYANRYCDNLVKSLNAAGSNAPFGGIPDTETEVRFSDEKTANYSCFGSISFAAQNPNRGAFVLCIIFGYRADACYWELVDTSYNTLKVKGSPLDSIITNLNAPVHPAFGGVEAAGWKRLDAKAAEYRLIQQAYLETAAY